MAWVTKSVSGDCTHVELGPWPAWGPCPELCNYVTAQGPKRTSGVQSVLSPSILWQAGVLCAIGPVCTALPTPRQAELCLPHLSVHCASCTSPCLVFYPPPIPSQTWLAVGVSVLSGAALALWCHFHVIRYALLLRGMLLQAGHAKPVSCCVVPADRLITGNTKVASCSKLRMGLPLCGLPQCPWPDLLDT